MRLIVVVALCLFSFGCTSYTNIEKPKLNIDIPSNPVVFEVKEDTLIEDVANNIKSLQKGIIDRNAIISAYKEYYESN